MERSLRITAGVLAAMLYGCILKEEPYEEEKEISTVTEITTGIHPSVSPDGTLLAFSRNGAIYLSDTSATEVRKLTGGTQYDAYPQWSPDGKTIGFVRMGSSGSPVGTMMSISVALQIEKQLSLSQAVQCFLAGSDGNYYRYASVGFPPWQWSSNGSHIAFYSGSDTMTYLTILHSDGSLMMEATLLLYRERPQFWTGNTAGFTWLPGTDQILCTQRTANDSTYLSLFTMSTGSISVVSPYSGASNPSCSDNGRYAGFFSRRNYQYYVVDNQSATHKKIQAGSSPLRMTPDGKHLISYLSSYSTSPDYRPSPKIVAINVETGSVRTIAIAPNHYSFSFHPSSQWLYTSRNGIIRKVPIL
jgi:Tol biopolymer transport system component